MVVDTTGFPKLSSSRSLRACPFLPNNERHVMRPAAAAKFDGPTSYARSNAVSAHAVTSHGLTFDDRFAGRGVARTVLGLARKGRAGAAPLLRASKPTSKDNATGRAPREQADFLRTPGRR